MARELQRKTPEDYLRDCQAEEDGAHRRGHLKIFLGYASGVGKSVRMLAEAVRRRERGQDVVVGAVQPKASPAAQVLLQKLEVIPLTATGAMDVAAILRRRPAVCIVDGLAYDNAVGSANPARWRDVGQLADAGIQVIGSINIQYIAELAASVQAITGKVVQQTVPIAFIRSADEIEIVDAPAGGADGSNQAPDLQLSRLREMALVLAADVVDQQLTTYLDRQGLQYRFGAHERILVCITPRANVEAMMESATAIAERFHGELIAAYVRQAGISVKEQAQLDAKLATAEKAGAKIEILEGDDPIEALVEFAQQRGVTQLFIGHSQRTGWRARLWGTPVDKLIRLSRGMDVRVFPQ